MNNYGEQVSLVVTVLDSYAEILGSRFPHS